MFSENWIDVFHEEKVCLLFKREIMSKEVTENELGKL
jgi:hypothetical protein